MPISGPDRLCAFSHWLKKRWARLLLSAVALVVLGPFVALFALHAWFQIERRPPCNPPLGPVRVIVGDVEFRFPHGQVSLHGEDAPRKYRESGSRFYCQTPEGLPFRSGWLSVFVGDHKSREALGLSPQLRELSLGGRSRNTDVLLSEKLKEGEQSESGFQVNQQVPSLLVAEIGAQGGMRTRRYVSAAPGIFGRPALIDCLVAPHQSEAGARLFGDRCRFTVTVAEHTALSGQFFTAETPQNEWLDLISGTERWALSSIPEGEARDRLLSRDAKDLSDFIAISSLPPDPGVSSPR